MVFAKAVRRRGLELAAEGRSVLVAEETAMSIQRWWHSESPKASGRRADGLDVLLMDAEGWGKSSTAQQAASELVGT